MVDEITIQTRLPILSDNALRDVFDEIETNGFCCIPNYVQPQDLKQMQEFVSHAVAASRNDYIVFNGSEPVSGTGIAELAASSEFQGIFSRLYTLALKRPSPQVEFYQILRRLTGKGAAREKSDLTTPETCSIRSCATIG